MFLIRLGQMQQYLFSAFLIFSMYQEKRKEIQHNILSHPEDSRLILRGKFLVLLGATILSSVLMGVFAFTYDYFRPRAENIVIVNSLIRYFSLSFISLCLVTTAWGITQFLKRFRIIIGLAVVVAGFSLYSWILGLDILESLLLQKKIATGVFLLTLVIGTIYAYVGIFFYEKPHVYAIGYPVDMLIAIGCIVYSLVTLLLATDHFLEETKRVERYRIPAPYDPRFSENKIAEPDVVLNQIIKGQTKYHDQKNSYIGFSFGKDCPEIGFGQPRGRFTYAFTPVDSLARAMENGAKNDVNGDGDGDDGLTLSIYNVKGVISGSSGKDLSW